MLQEEVGFTVYVSNYVGRRVLGLVGVISNARFVDAAAFDVDHDMTGRIVELYKLNCCWTWSEHWRWPKVEHFLRVGGDTAERATTVPLVLFDI
jgi:hypothetical protein